MKELLDKAARNWQSILIVLLLVAVAYLVGSRNSKTEPVTQAQNQAIQTAQPAPEARSPMCNAEPIKFEKIEKNGLTVTFTYILPKNFNSGVDYGDGTHSKYKANVSNESDLAVDTYTYPKPGVYEVGLYTYDYENACDNGIATKITLP